MKIGVVIPTFNRARSVLLSVRSAFEALACTDVLLEVIVVDDCSSDDTGQQLAQHFAAELAAGTLRYLENHANCGVTGSKNIGYASADVDWVVFLDSDDTLMREHGGELVDTLRRHGGTPIVFFRCVDENGAFVGRHFHREVQLDLATYLQHTSFGEALTVINKRLVPGEPYVEALRGYEGLGCCRIIRRYGPAVLSNVVARRYDQRGDDRLSASRGYLRRMSQLGRGHRMLLAEFGAAMTFRNRCMYWLKAAVYQMIGSVYRRVA